MLAPGGTFVTQQVDGRDLTVNAALGGPPHEDSAWRPEPAAAALAAAGLEVSWRCEFTTVFHDAGALVLFLRVLPWQVPGFDTDAYGDRLRALHEEMERGRPLRATARRFALVAHRR